MIDNPTYNGDYIAQAKAEVKIFMLILEETERQKAQGFKYEHGNTTPLDLPSFPSFSFPHFQKYTDEKLSSSNPKIYISDLDELYLDLQNCISKYCLIIEKQISETEKIFAENAFYNNQNPDLSNLIFFRIAQYCFRIKDYYRRKRKLVDATNNDFEGNQDADYFLDKDEIRKLLGSAFDQISDNKVDIFISHILFYKYGGNKPKEIPDMHLVGVSQRDLILICKAIIKNLKLGSGGRFHLSEVFGELIYKYENYQPVKYNKETIRKNI